MRSGEWRGLYLENRTMMFFIILNVFDRYSCLRYGGNCGTESSCGDTYVAGNAQILRCSNFSMFTELKSLRSEMKCIDRYDALEKRLMVSYHKIIVGRNIFVRHVWHWLWLLFDISASRNVGTGSDPADVRWLEWKYLRTCFCFVDKIRFWYHFDHVKNKQAYMTSGQKVALIVTKDDIGFQNLKVIFDLHSDSGHFDKIVVIEIFTEVSICL